MKTDPAVCRSRFFALIGCQQFGFASEQRRNPVIHVNLSLTQTLATLFHLPLVTKQKQNISFCAAASSPEKAVLIKSFCSQPYSNVTKTNIIDYSQQRLAEYTEDVGLKIYRKSQKKSTAVKNSSNVKFIRPLVAAQQMG